MSTFAAADFWVMFAGTTLLGLILFVLLATGVRQPGRRLERRFQSLGELPGRTRDEIVAAVGQPTGQSIMTGGGLLLRWDVTGYHIAVGFSPDGRCYGIASVTRN